LQVIYYIFLKPLTIFSCIKACKFDNLYQLPDQLQAVEKHAMQCSLYNIGPLPGPDWPKAGQCALIDDFFKSTSLDYRVISVENDIAQVSLQIKGEDIGDLLVKSGVAKRIQLPQPLMSKPGRRFVYSFHSV
jgi:hypothetical protein